MTSNRNRLIDWLKTFQTVWLPENIPDDNRLLGSIRTKLHEFEQIILESQDDDDDDEAYYRARLLDDRSASNSENDEIPIASTSTHEAAMEQSTHVSQESNDEDEEERARRMLLEQSDASEDNEDDLRPAILLKRISPTDAERYMPLAWRPNQHESNDSSSSSDDEDYNIKYRTRNSLLKKGEKSSTPNATIKDQTRKKGKDIFINYNIPTNVDEPLLEDALTMAEEMGPIDEDGVLQELIENHDNESLFDSLVIQPDKTNETDPIRLEADIPNEPIEQLSTEDSSDDQPPIQVLSYAHLLHQSSSETDNSKEKSTSKKSKRTTISPSDSDESPVKKKSKVIRQRAVLSSVSSSSDDDENNRTLTNRNDDDDSSSSSPQTNNRIRIERSSSSSDDSVVTKKPKRRTRKNSTSTDEETSPSKGRKNIRKILDDQELDIHTKDAIAAERERRKRITENQKKYNDSLLEQSLSQATTTTDLSSSPPANPRLILELDKNTNEPLIEVDRKLVEQMKPHQCDGVRFLWNNVFESIEAIEKKKNAGNGCILAHCMGLGKTLQVISFIHTVFNANRFTKVKTCLVLCPKNAALNWSNEFDHWLNGIEPSIDHYQLATIKTHLRNTHLTYWHNHGGVMIMGYDIYRQLANGNRMKNKKTRDDILRCLVDPGPDIIVADEGHILKNSQTALAKCLSKIKTRRRIVLTGTPLQNNLIEYYCMVSFIKPNLLGSQGEYINRFVNPIQNGQHRDSNEEDVRLMKRRACVLHEVLTGFVDRKDYSLLREYLPPKYEYIINIRLSDLQSKLYQLFLEKAVNKEQRTLGTRKDFQSAKLFSDFHYLQKIWTHPFILYPHFIERWKKRLSKGDETSVDDNEEDLMFIDDEDENIRRKKSKSNKAEKSYSGFLIDNVKEETSPRRASNSSTTTLDSDISIEENLDGDQQTGGDDDDIEIIRSYPTRSRVTIPDVEKKSPDVSDDEPWLNEMREQFWHSILDVLPNEDEFNLELGGKFLLLKYLLERCTEIGDKVIVFARSLLTLNYIEKLLQHWHEQNAEEYREYLSSMNDTTIQQPIQWQRDADYFRMDGQTEVTARKRYTKIFNNLSNTRARLFLISTLAGGIGINLVGSNRVIVFDASWNPSHDTQAIFRSYRFGQKKPVYIYRFLAHGTMEEKIYQRQVVKQSLSQRVVDDHQLDRHFTQNDIKELYKFQPEPLPQASTAATAEEFHYALPKDHLLLDLLCQHNRWIHSYHSHDSLLENKLDEGLTADERRRALEEYENLKRLPDPRQVAMERFQQQQRLNAQIAQQNAAAAQLRPNLQQTFHSINGRNTQFDRLFQHWQMNGLLNSIVNPHRSTVPIQPRPNNTSNETITVESDEESSIDPVPK